jgi:hypothetical protein
LREARASIWFVPLEQQDPGLWNDSQIALAEKLLREGSP